MYHYHIHGALSAPHNMYWVCMTSIRLAERAYNKRVEFNKVADAAIHRELDLIGEFPGHPYTPDGKRILFLDELEDFEDEE
jgi:hypothetical protein